MTLGLVILSCALAAGTCRPAADPGVRSYAVRVNGPAGSTVRLSALDVPRGWIASFCSPRVCSPFHVALPLRAGSGSIQISYVRTAATAPALRALHVAARVSGRRLDARRTAGR
jgi:hypothetical protein